MSYLSLLEIEEVARRAHSAQTDKAGRPYVEHLVAVADGVRARGGSEAQIAAAWLHDAFEDGVLGFDWLTSAALPNETKAIVLALTKRVGETTEDYAKRIRTTPGAVLVKEADLAHNADPNRLAALNDATRERLTKKYATIRRLLDITSNPPHHDDANK